MDENKNMNVEETEEIVEKEEVSKVRGFMKKNGKRIAAGVAVIAVSGVAYILGKNSIKTFPAVDIGDVVDDVTDAAETFTEV